ncbi:hypothetical protein MCETALH18_01562 [Methylophilaceae bacterium]
MPVFGQKRKKRLIGMQDMLSWKIYSISTAVMMVILTAWYPAVVERMGLMLPTTLSTNMV